jgi:cytochrome c
VASADLRVEGEMQNKGIGPIKQFVPEMISEPLVERGRGLFKARCTSCHKMDQRYVGPALKGVTFRRSPEWIMNMMLNPLEMTQKDPIAKKLLSIHSTQMNSQDLSHEDARAIFEYLRME